jgi:uncharacterized membrane protein
MTYAYSLPAAGSLVFENVEHAWLWILLIVAGAAILALTYHGIFQRSERRLTWVLMVLRGVGLMALLLALAKPTWTRETRLVDPGRVAVVLDNSLSMSLADPSGKTRYALAKDAVKRLTEGLEKASGGPALAVDLADINGNPVKTQDIPDQPTVERTDLARAVSETRDRLRSKPVMGLVVISDGMDNTGRQDFTDLADVPIYTVGFRADKKASDLDLAVKDPRAPARALVQNPIQVVVPVTKTGGPATSATVSIKLGAETYTSKKIDFDAGNAEQQVALDLTPTKAGSFVFTATVECEAGERTLANNSKHFALQVDKDRIRVLYVEGFLRYEYKYLKNRLQEDPDVLLTPLVREINPDQSTKNPGRELLTPEALKKFDVVILGDLEGSYFSDSEYQALVKWLDDKTHSLLLLGGYHSFGPDGFRATPLAEVLPVVFAEKPPYQSEDPFIIQLTDVGRRHPIFTIARDPTKDQDTWSQSPPLLGSALVQRAKPSAEVLAVNPNVVIDNQPAVVAAIHRWGNGGHAMVLTADTTWRWTRLTRVLGQNDTLYARFWGQTIRWLAGRTLEDQRPVLTVNTDQPSYELGKTVAVRVVRQSPTGADISGAEVGVEVSGPGGKAVPLEMKASTAEPDVFTGTFKPATGGRYSVAATLTEAGNAIANQAGEFVVQGSDLELADPDTNPSNLKAMADSTGGRYFDIEKADELIDLMPRKERQIARVEPMRFWNSPWLFAAFLTAVSAEWFIRRRNHLV